ncbi:flagellin lysine-N-methylase [Pyxidicoccus sp. MSG2]|uniref:flagellin lysine-N-methylase n=1 Tax=Pyxidicoccus sp. MSG2 TaxID=2996790 RepID=UPI00226FC360|nr:flagellin lysine-N-methylase [Pyxidicoccus sp. MSG2]MCY1019615.1 flagellin lysine-N-methylase [Pyxidicoccus sp. MSG2]
MTATAPRYMTRFRCLADACEDTCCAGLVVTVSEARWTRLRDAVAGGPDAARVEAFIRPDEGSGPGAEAAVIAKREDGHCVFLDERKLCSLHRAHGEAVLPDACATFPRVATRGDERLEVVGSLACPEVARLCLLAEDGVEPVPVSDDVAVRPELARRLGGDAWTGNAEAVRAVAVRLLQRREVPFASRLFALGQLALRLDGFYFRGTEAFSGGAEALLSGSQPDGAEALPAGRHPEAARIGAETLLADVLRSFDAPETLAELHAGFSAIALPGGPWAAICATVLKARVGAVRSERFAVLARAALASYGGAEVPDEVWRIHSERCAKLVPSLSERVEQYFRHHAVNHWLRHPFTDAPTLLDYVFRLTLRAAVLRWTLFGHPTVVALCGVEDSAEARAQLDAAAVECFQLVAKHVEQAPELHSLAQGLAGKGGAETLGRMLVLLKGL